MFNLIRSPYLLVFGDDRVHSTREQMMLMQVVLVRLSYGAGMAWEFYVFIIIDFEIICKHLRDAFILFPDVIIYGFWFIIGSNKSFKFPALLGNEVLLNAA